MCVSVLPHGVETCTLTPQIVSDEEKYYHIFDLFGQTPIFSIIIIACFLVEILLLLLLHSILLVHDDDEPLLNFLVKLTTESLAEFLCVYWSRRVLCVCLS